MVEKVAAVTLDPAQAGRILNAYRTSQGLGAVRPDPRLMAMAQRQADVILAQTCAQNELVRLRLINQMPAVGDTTVNCPQLGRQLQVQVSVRPTPNPSFRRVDAQVFSEAAAVLRVSTIVGRY